MKKLFTNKPGDAGNVDEITLPEGKNDHWLWDEQQSGLGLRIRLRGENDITKTWYVAYKANGQERRDPLGRFSDLTLNDARNRVYEIRRDAVDGIAKAEGE